jgi:voltage-gated potassium channel
VIALASPRDRYVAFIAQHEVAWELAFAALAVLYVAVGVLGDAAESPGLLVLEWILTGIFAAEFVTRLLASRNRQAYLRGHWVDVIALVPPVRGLRVLRLLRLLRLVRAFAGVARALSTFDRLINHRGLIWLLAAWLAVMAVCSMGLYATENGVNAAIDSPLDALWWGVVTMTTVGYGDVAPITPEGRLAASILMILGIGLFSAVTATITSFMLGDRADPLADLERLANLRDRGVVTEQEFAQKREALGRQLASARK